MWKWWIEGTKLSIFAILSNGKKGSKKVQLVSKHCNKMTWIVMWHVLPPTFTQRLAKKTRLWQVAWILTADWIRLRRSHMTSLLKIILQRSWPRECEDACHPWVYTSIYSSRSIYHLTILDLRARTNYKDDILLKVWCWPLIGNHRHQAFE